MLRIAVFDENLSWLDKLRRSLNQKTDTVQTIWYSDYSQLIQEVSKSKNKPDAVLLGLTHNSRNQTLHRAEEITRMANKLPVLYVAEDTAIWDQTIMFAHVNLSGFITMPLIENVLDRYLYKISDMKEAAKLLTIKSNGKESCIRVDNILYLESRKHIAHIFTDSEEIKTYAKLSELLPQLPAYFFQPHKSYLVNANRVSIAGLNNLILDNGESIPVSRSRKSEVRKRIIQKNGFDLEDEQSV